MNGNRLSTLDGLLNFTIGPVQMHPETLATGAKQIPYFRNAEFSEVYFENERLINKFLQAGNDAKALFMTGSGTASMEAAILNLFSGQDKLLVINGGTFGARFSEICKIHDIPYSEINLNYGEPLTERELCAFENKGYSGLLVNLHETSTGVVYDMDLISGFATRNNLILVTDAISAFLAETIETEKHRIDALIIGSQKALALPPGLSIISLSNRAIDRILRNNVKSLYFDLRIYLKDGARGQTPFTPAVGTLIQLNDRLRRIDETGYETEIAQVRNTAAYFRENIASLPLKIFAKTPANAVTALYSRNGQSAQTICNVLKTDYKIFVCPNGGELQHKIFRVGHIGYITQKDNDRLIDALKDINRRKLL
jgi:aspartate aminotransferase-like enzyme